MKENSTEVGSVRCGRMDLGLKLYSSLSLCLHLCSYSRTLSSPQAIPSTTRNPVLHHSSLLPPSLVPAIPGGAATWVAGGGRRRDLGAASQKANRCRPSGVSQMADIKRSWGGQKKMKTSPRMSTVLHISLPSLFFHALPEKRFFLLSSFLLKLSTSSAQTSEDSVLLSDTFDTSTQGLAMKH